MLLVLFLQMLLIARAVAVAQSAVGMSLYTCACVSMYINMHVRVLVYKHARAIILSTVCKATNISNNDINMGCPINTITSRETTKCSC